MPRAKRNPEDLRVCSQAWHRYLRRNRQKANKAANRRRLRAKLNLEDLRACSLAWPRYPRRNRQKASKAANRRRLRAKLNPVDLRACSLAWHRYLSRNRQKASKAANRRRLKAKLNPVDLRVCSQAWHRHRHMRPQRQQADQREVRRRERRGGHRVPRGPFVLRTGRALRPISSSRTNHGRAATSTSAQASLVRARIATVDVAEDHERGPHPSGAILSPVDPDLPGGLSQAVSLFGVSGTG